MRIVWKKSIGNALLSIAATLIGSAWILLLIRHEPLASSLNVIGCSFLVIYNVYRMKCDPAYRDRNPFDRNDKLRLF